MPEIRDEGDDTHPYPRFDFLNFKLSKIHFWSFCYSQINFLLVNGLYFIVLLVNRVLIDKI